MRIMIGLHHVVLGGDTINALEIADRLRGHGHHATLFAFCEPGTTTSSAPLLALAERRGVDVEVFPRASGVVDRLALVRGLAAYARRHRVDVVHSFGHQDTYFSFAATHGLAGVPLVVNDYQMALTAGLPRRVPLVVGTEEVLGQARRARPGATFLVEPPVDTEQNRPGAVDGAGFRAAHGIGPDETLVVVVSRLARDLKFEGLRGVIDAVAVLGEPGVRLAVVGDGSMRPALAERATRVNAGFGRDAVVLTGAMLDPRPAYAAADVVVGMGHSGLRGMAFGKPVVVIGEHGFALPVHAGTLDHLRYHGVYGVGAGGDVAAALAAHLRPLVADPVLRNERGALGREFVVSRYGLDHATERLIEVYAAALGSRSVRAWLGDLGYLGATYVPGKVGRTLRRLRPARFA